MSAAPETLESLVRALWRKCVLSARETGTVPAEAVSEIIQQTRVVCRQHGATKRDADGLLFLILNDLHWDGDQPTDRIFETVLDFELTDFFRESGINEPTNVS